MHQRMTSHPRTLLALVAVSTLACARANETASSANPPSHAPPSHEGESVTPSSPPSTQLAVGEKYFARDCVACHGDQGQGATGGPRIIGAGALPIDPPSSALQRKTHFVTARDVHDFIATHMPNDVIGQMPDSYYWDTLAFVLSRNGVDLGGKVLDDTDASSIALHP